MPTSPPRIVGVDDGPFRRVRGSRCVIAVVLHEGLRPVSVDFAYAEVDGRDATRAAIEAVRGMHPDLVVVDSVTACGFNYIDGRVLAEETGAPVLHVYLYPLDMSAVERALAKAGLLDDRLEVVRVHWGAARRAECRLGGFWYTAWGDAPDPCALQRYSRIPLPLQNAHRLARLAARLLLRV